MTPDIARAKLLTVRLTEREYEVIKVTSIKQGIRSMAEFVRRGIVCQVARQGSINVTFPDDLTTLSVRLQELDAELKEASACIGRLLGSGKREGES